MKPPSRTRIKPDRSLKAEPAARGPRRLACKWQRREQRKLLDALKKLQKTTEAREDIDYAFLRKCVPRRSISEIHSVVESLKNKVISCASFALRKKSWEEKKVRKPIEVWTHMASAVAGTLVEPISTAFAQMLIVSSTEPRTLKNCDPPKVHRPQTGQDIAVGRTVPLRPMPRVQVQGKHPGTSADLPLRVLNSQAPTVDPSKGLQAPTVGPSKGLQAPTIGLSNGLQASTVDSSKGIQALTQVVSMPDSSIPSPQPQLATTARTSSTATSCQPVVVEIVAPVAPGCCSAAAAGTADGSSVIQTTKQQQQQQQPPPPSVQRPTATSTASTSRAMLSSPSAPCPAQDPGSSATSSCSAPTPPLPSSPAAACHARFGRTSKHATEDSPRTFGVKCVVDFEKIYRYLSDIANPNDNCHLTPMESAILLDLLMSLPEELPLLDCNKLHKHLLQVYKCLSCPANTKVAREMFKDLREALCAQKKAPGGRDGDGASSQRGAAAGTARAKNQVGGRHAAGRLGDADLAGLCPPLNPFMVPVKLLARRKIRVQNK